jgi:hypothetical protein
VGPIETLIANYTRYHEAGIPFYVGEFSFFYAGTCPDGPLEIGPYLAMLQELAVGWLAWSWGGVMNSGCDGTGHQDMTVNGYMDEFTEWGLKVAQSDPNSIAKTSIRLDSLVVTACP